MNRIEILVFDNKTGELLMERDNSESPILTLGFDGSIRSQYYTNHEKLTGEFLVILKMNGEEKVRFISE